MQSVGFICSLDSCNLQECAGAHHNYYAEINDDLVPICIDEIIRYIAPAGFRIHYQRQVATINEQAQYISSHEIDINERPAKRQRFK